MTTLPAPQDLVDAASAARQVRDRAEQLLGYHARQAMLLGLPLQPAGRPLDLALEARAAELEASALQAAASAAWAEKREQMRRRVADWRAGR